MKLTTDQRAELIALLGKFSDRELARRFGVGHVYVNGLRKSRDIPAAPRKKA